MITLADTLRDYLKKQWPDCDDVRVEGLRDVPGGWSKETHRFDAHVLRGGETTILPLILRADTDPVSAPLQNSRALEHELLRRLREHTEVPVPQSYFVEMDPATFGRPAMVIERIAGSTEPSSLWKGPEGAAAAEGVARDLCEKLAALHTADVRLLNGDGLFNDPRGIGLTPDTWDHYMDGMTSYFVNNYHTIDFDTLPVHFDAFLFLRRNKPRPLPLCLIHGELNPFNLIFEGGKLKGIVDWEMAQLGDPRQDLGYFRCFERLTGTRFFESVSHPGGFLGYYNELTGFEVTSAELDYFEMFGISVVSMQSVASTKRRVQGKHQEIMPIYMIQPTMGVVQSFAQILQKYPA
jgi:aminoglycoside phosphotransferase (APT) family kinase protein